MMEQGADGRATGQAYLCFAYYWQVRSPRFHGFVLRVFVAVSLVVPVFIGVSIMYHLVCRPCKVFSREISLYCIDVVNT